MPWHIEDDHPDCDGFAVVKDDDRAVEGCHDTRSAALEQMAALYAAEEGASGRAEPRQRRSGPLGRRDRRLLPAQVVQRLSEAFGPDALAVAHRGFDIDYAGKRLEHRATKGQLELRQNGDTDLGPVIRGYATTYGDPYDIWGGPPFGFRETVEAGAAAKSVQERDDVYLFFDHEGLPLAATKAGTLTLTSDSRGLYSEARPDRGSPYSMEVVSRLERGELDSMSFAFEVVDDEWSDDFTERSIREVKLFDVSVVSFPANPATTVGLRSATPAPVRRGMSIAHARAVRDALDLRV